MKCTIYRLLAAVAVVGSTLVAIVSGMDARDSSSVPTRDEMRRLFADEFTDNETREMQTLITRIRDAGPAVLPDLLDLYREHVTNRTSTVAGGCAEHILRLATGDASRSVIRSLSAMRSIHAAILALDVATSNGLPSEEFRPAAEGLFARTSEYSSEFRLSGVELLVRFEQYCRSEDASLLLKLMGETSDDQIYSRRHGATLLAKIGNAASLQGLRELYQTWTKQEPARIEMALQRRRIFWEESGNVWDPDSPSAKDGLMQGWLFDIGTSLTNLESRLKSEGRLPAPPR